MLNIDEPVHIVAYSDQWPRLFEEEKERLKHALNKQSIELVHIGSTSIPGVQSQLLIL